MARLGMAFDLRRCIGCQTCTAACKMANGTPPGVQWRRVVDMEMGTYPDVKRVFMKDCTLMIGGTSSPTA